MAVNTIYATPSRSGGQPYLWIPFKETTQGGYFALNGDISAETFRKLSGLPNLSMFFDDFQDTLWITESKHKKLVDEIRNKATKGYQEFGSIAPFLGRFEGVSEDGNSSPFGSSLDSLSESDLRMYRKVRVRRALRQISELIQPSWLEPVWG